MPGIPAGGLKDFDLECAIREWRTRRRWQDGLAVDQIKEIEDHLRSRIEELVEDGLAPQEALSVALHRLGEIKGLAHDTSSALSAVTHPTPLPGRTSVSSSTASAADRLEFGRCE